MSVYPSGIDSFITKVDNVDDVMAADVNLLQDAIVAIETTLGTGTTNFVNVSGDTMTGDLVMTSGLSIVMGPVKIGSNTTANNINSVAIGNSSTSTAISSVAIGFGAGALADFSTAIGYANTSNGYQSLTIGTQNLASSAGSQAIGVNNNAFAVDTVVIGGYVNGTLGGVLYLGAPSGVMIQTGKNLLPEASGTQNLGSASLPFSGIYSNNYITTRVSGTVTSSTTTINWSNGASQLLTFSTGQPSGTSLLFSGMAAGSSYALQTKSNQSGTAIITWPASVLWKGGTTGTMTLTASANDLFTFYSTDGTASFGNAGNDYR